MVGEATDRVGKIGARKRVPDLQIGLTPRHLADVAPWLGRVVPDGVIHPLAHLVRRRHYVRRPCEVRGVVVVRYGICLDLAGGPRIRGVVSENAANRDDAYCTTTLWSKKIGNVVAPTPLDVNEGITVPCK